MNSSLKGRSNTTGAVHLARKVRHQDRSVTELMLAQRCGMSYRAIAYLASCPEDTPLTCKRCIALNVSVTQ